MARCVEATIERDWRDVDDAATICDRRSHIIKILLCDCDGDAIVIEDY